MTLRTKGPLLAVTALVCAFGFQSAAYANAFYLQAQSARGTGRAFSGEGADTGAASLWWNPAAIAGIRDGSAAIAATAIRPKGDVIDNGTVIGRPTFSATGVRNGTAYTPVGGNTVSSDPINNGVVPSGAVAYPITDRIAVGLAVTSPFSFTTNYEANSWARYTADKTRLRTIDVQPSIAVAVTDWLRVGGALNVEYTDAILNNALPNLSAALPDGFQELKGDGWDLGWTAGVQLHNDFATVGISYKSSIRHKLKGTLDISGLVGPLAASNVSIDNATASFNTPGQVIVAGRFRGTDKLTLNAQVVAYNWSKFDTIDLGAPLNTAIPESYRDSWSLAGGFDYDISPKATLRAGIQRAKTPTQNGLRDARVPDSNRWTYAAGGSYQLTPRMAVDFGANYIDFADTTIDRLTAAYAGTAVVTPIVTNGLLRNASAIEVSLGGRLTF